jgi:hypothetical protein
MNPPKREPAWRYPVRILAAAVVSIGGVVADALNPGVPNPATLAALARRC